MMKQETSYKFECDQCGIKLRAEMMPPIEVMKKIGYHINCPKCGKRIAILQ